MCAPTRIAHAVDARAHSGDVVAREKHQADDDRTHALPPEHAYPEVPSRLPGSRAPVGAVLFAHFVTLPFAIAGAVLGARRQLLEGKRALRGWRDALVVHIPTIVRDSVRWEGDAR